MPDSPRCPNDGFQTYRVFGVSEALYRCQKCGNRFPHDQFDEEAFLWKDEPERHKAWLADKSKKRGKPGEKVKV